MPQLLSPPLILPGEWVGIGENRSGLPGEMGQNRSELVKTGSKLGKIGRNVPRNTKNPREEASKSQ